MILLFARYCMAEEFCGRKISPSPATFETFHRIYFSQCGKDCFVVINTGDIICVQIFHQKKQVGKLAKISSW